MSNFTITNKQGGILSLAPLHDESGATLVLHPKGQKGAAKEISAETADHEIVQRVKKANWVSLEPVGTLAAAVAEPAPESTPVAESTPESTPVAEEPKPESTPAPESPPESTHVAEEPKPEPETTVTSETPVDPSSRTFPSDTPSKKRR